MCLNSLIASPSSGVRPILLLLIALPLLVAQFITDRLPNAVRFPLISCQTDLSASGPSNLGYCLYRKDIISD